MTTDDDEIPAEGGPPADQRGPCGRPYRPCVGLMLFRGDQVFGGRRRDSAVEAWQMPQGGVDPGETPREAALRELGEEVGLAPSHVEIVAVSRRWVSYDLPERLSRKLWGGRFAGQTQKWFALRMLASDAAINIETAEPEFQAWRWMSAEDMVAAAVGFKRDIYRDVFTEFAEALGAA